MNENFDLNAQTFGEQSNANQFVPRKAYGLNEKSYNERREIKKISRLSGGAFLSLLVASTIFGIILLIGLVIFGFSEEKARELLQNSYLQQFVQIILSTFMFVIPFAFFFKCGGYKISEIVSFEKPKTKNWVAIVLMGVGFCSFANIAVSMAAAVFEGFGINYEVDYGENPTGVFGVILTLISTAVIPPLVEEFACRGVMLGALRKFGDSFAIIVSSVMFGIIHGNFQQAPFAFLIGLILGFVTVKCNSIWPAILIHAYNNLMSVIFQYAFIGVSTELQNVIYTFYMIICLFVGILGILLIKGDTEILKLSPAETEACEKQKYKWFFLTETIIFVILICIFNSLQYFKF